MEGPVCKLFSLTVGIESSSEANLRLKYWSASTGIVEIGKVTGAGVYAKGKKVTLKATAAKGYAFNGWYDCEGLVSQAASHSFIPKSADVTYEARFVTVEEDKASIRMEVNGTALSSGSGQESASPLATNVMCGVALRWPVATCFRVYADGVIIGIETHVPSHR